MVPMGYSGARGTLIYEKNLKAKILCQTPFKGLWGCTEHVDDTRPTKKDWRVSST